MILKLTNSRKFREAPSLLRKHELNEKSQPCAMRLISGSKFTAEKQACPSVDPAGAQLVLKIQPRLVTSRRPAQDSQRPLYDSIYSDLLDIF